MTKRKCQSTAADRELRRRSRIQRSFEQLVTGALVTLPRLLDECPPQVAANVITDLLRIHLGRPLPDIPQPNCLECLLEDIASEPRSPSPNPSDVSDLSDMSDVSHPMAPEFRVRGLSPGTSMSPTDN